MYHIQTEDEKFLPAQDSTFTMRSHRRQFVIGSEPFHAYDDWCCRQLDSSTWVSYCPELRVGWTSDTEGVRWCLLGLAVETLEDKTDPLMEIARNASIDVPNLYPSWAGRWVLIGRTQVHMDASGLLGCFYGMTPDKQMWVSSSPTLLARILSPDTLPTVDPRTLHYRTGIAWFTPPRSRFAGIYRLLPSQILQLNDGSIQPRPLIPPIDPSRDYDETLELLKRSMVTALRRLPREGKKLWLRRLSAGFDSRLVLAMAQCAGVDIMPFTRIAARMSLADRVLPPKLARECGYKHIFFRGHKGNSDRAHLVAEHSAGHVSDGDAEPFIQGVRDSIEGLSLGGWCFEVAKGFKNLRLLQDTVNDPETNAQQIAQLFREPTTSTVTVGVREWLEWVSDHPQEHLDWRDRFYIEQRLAGWISSKEQLYDLTKIERIPILNAARNYALMLGLKESQRLGSVYQVELIRRTVPELLKYPGNPDDRYFGILQEIRVKSSDNPLYVYRKNRGQATADMAFSITAHKLHKREKLLKQNEGLVCHLR